jgi:acyl-coenzyme A synthetase/AMP-(fatty) acid ligase
LTRSKLGLVCRPDCYANQYWSKYPGAYFTGGSARKDEDGYSWIIGRVDDVIKMSLPEKITIVDKLPKTRSGKIMRRVLKARTQGLPEGDITTLEE